MITVDAVGARQKTVTLSDGVVAAVDFGTDYKYYAVRNDGNAEIYVSTVNKECTSGEKDVVPIPPGAGYVYYNGLGGNREIYLLGNGPVLIVAQNTDTPPFKQISKGGDTQGDDTGGMQIPYSISGLFKI